MNGLAILGVAMRAGWLLGSLGAGAVIAHFGSGCAYFAVAAGLRRGALALLPASRGRCRRVAGSGGLRLEQLDRTSLVAR